MIEEGMIVPNEGKALSCYSSTRDKCCLYFRCCACFACCSFFCCKDTHPIQDKMTDGAGSKRASDAGAMPIKHFPTRKYYEVKAYDSYPEWTRDDAAIWDFDGTGARNICCCCCLWCCSETCHRTFLKLHCRCPCSCALTTIGCFPFMCCIPERHMCWHCTCGACPKCCYWPTKILCCWKARYERLDERQNVYEAPTPIDGDSLTGPELRLMGSPPKKRNKDEVQEVAPLTETMVDSSPRQLSA